ncbi:HAD family hydrolase [Streptacidiphilus sp. N1-12]|uniref:HAD family hydrolase n=2 Tax=Streptacidiphilus alkalitolerans TaxID=3342712 RepID=A0ABV6WKY7_9ACTN
MIRAVVFDVGETITSDRRFWADWADWLDAPAYTVAALVGAVVAQGRDNADALRLIRPGLDVAAEYAVREASGRGERLEEEDLYPDVREGLQALQNAGYWVGVVGNQTARAAELLRALGLPVNAVATSGEWGVAKPAPAFFARLSQWSGCAPEQIVHVGDHPANDVVPARAAGMRTVHLRRGPWGYLWADSAGAAQADWHADSLLDLPGLIAGA